MATWANRWTSLFRMMPARCCALRAAQSYWCPGMERTVIRLRCMTWAAISRTSMSDAARWGLSGPSSTTALLSTMMVDYEGASAAATHNSWNVSFAW